MTAVYFGMSAAAQKQAVSDALDRTYALVSDGIAARKAKELAKVQDKYVTNSALPALQADIDALAARKDTAASAVFSLKQAGTNAQKVLEHLNVAHAAAVEGRTSAFDNAINQINILIGSRGADLENLVGNAAPGQSGQRTMSISTGTTQVVVALQSLGSRYVLTDKDNGRIYTPNFLSQTLSIGGAQVATSQLSLVSRDGDDVSFTDGTTTWNATLDTGGLPLTSSWLYGGLTGDGQTMAIEDIKASISLVSKAVVTLSNTNLQAEIGMNTLQNQLTALGETARTVSDTESDELAAAKKAIETRYSLMNSNIAFAAQAQREMIGALIGDDRVSSKSVFDIMGTVYSG